MTWRDEIKGVLIFDAFPDNPSEPGADASRNLNASLMRVLSTGRPDIMEVQDLPPDQLSRHTKRSRRLLLGLFHGVPTTKKSVFDLPVGPDYVVLYQKSIEAE
jgi:predicted Zn-dependent protease with MMP-like domain